MLYENFACAADARTCARVAKEIVARTPEWGGNSIEPCEPVHDAVYLYCAARAGKPVCSAQQPFCEALLTAAPGKGGTCRQYRRGAVGRGP